MIYKLKFTITLGFCLFFYGISSLFAQEKKELTLKGIFKDHVFNEKSVRGVNWMRDGNFYTSKITNDSNTADYVLKYDIKTGNVVDTIVNGSTLLPKGAKTPLRFDAYSFSADEQKILISSQKEGIYRRSSKSYFYIYDLRSEKLQKLTDGPKQSYATFSPDGSKVAYVRDNNLFYKDLSTMEEHTVTKNGEWNKIINGSSDWVYEEEFAFAKAFFWSPDGKNLAYYIFDESAVKEYHMQIWAGLYPSDYNFKYPKAGEKNSTINIAVYDLASGQSKKMDIGKEKNIYIPRIYWAHNPSLLSIIRLNRLQNKLEILHADINSGKTKVILTEESETYVDINFTDDLTYLHDNKYFIRTSEKDGFKHIYLHKLDGTLVRQITKGNWVVSKFLGVDEKKKLVYFISTENSSTQRQLYSITLDGKHKTKLTKEVGVHEINFSPDFKYYIDKFSSSVNPVSFTLHEAPSGRLIKILEDNKELKEKLANYKWSDKELFTLKTKNGVSLNAYTIKPPDFDENKTYPVLMYVYGGPGSQQVMNQWESSRELWFHYLAQEGYIVACVDNRGTGGKGREFKHLTYGKLGKIETEDQIESAKYFASLPYVDGSRIGIWGWSYGGYMSSLAMFLGADVFKAGIAVAPVTNWRFYDTIYTERYLKTPQENPEGYDDYSPLTHVDKLKGKYLLIHGTGDDNVHFQNSVALVDGLIAANKQFNTFYYPNRNHSIYGGNTRLHLYKMMSNFVLKNL